MGNFDKYGIDEEKGIEGLYRHINYPGLQFNKSSFMKEWVDKYIDKDIKTIFDIGALEGGDSLRFSSWYPNAKVYTIEASPHNYSVMNKKLNNKVKNIHTFNYAMSSKNGTIEFYRVSYNDTTNSVGENHMVMGSIYDLKEYKKQRHRLSSMSPIEVESITFDTFCKNQGITDVDIIHVDIEGAGYSLCKGMNEILPKLIFIEKEGNEFYKNKNEGGNDELLKLLESKGYSLVLNLNNDFLFLKQ